MSLLNRLRTTIGESYDIERELGGGGMSRVFLAEDVRLRRKVVVKVLSLPSSAREWTRGELRRLERQRVGQ